MNYFVINTASLKKNRISPYEILKLYRENYSGNQFSDRLSGPEKLELKGCQNLTFHLQPLVQKRINHHVLLVDFFELKHE